jgi:hypothetical protein
VKILLAVLLAMPLTVSAGIIATSANDGGGRIILGDTRNACPAGSLQAATYGRGRPLLGCWSGLGEGTGTIVVKWDDGDVSYYDVYKFDLTPNGLEWANSQP